MLRWLFGLLGFKRSAKPSPPPARKPSGKRRSRPSVSPQTLAELAKWEAYAESDKWMLVVFQRGQSEVAEVARINDAFLDKGKLKIDVEILKLESDRLIGQSIGIGRDMALDPGKIRWHEIVNAVDIRDVAGFQKLQKRLAKQA